MRPRLPIAARAATVRAGARSSGNLPDLAANLEHIVVSMRDWLIEAEAVPAQRIVVGKLCAQRHRRGAHIRRRLEREHDLAVPNGSRWRRRKSLHSVRACSCAHFPPDARAGNADARIPGAAHRPLSSLRHQLSNRFGCADRLTLTRGNGACERLLPCHSGTFTLPHDHYFQLEFRRDTSGAAAAMLFHEATGICVVEIMPQPR